MSTGRTSGWAPLIIGAGLLATAIIHTRYAPVPEAASASRPLATADYSYEDDLRRRLRTEPEDEILWRELTIAADTRELERDSEPYLQTRDVLPTRFIEMETTRYVIFSDAPVVWTREMAGYLERAHHQYIRFCRRSDLRPLPLRHKLVCVLFQHRNQYRNFAARQDGVNSSWIAGYYSPQNDRIVFYNVQSNPSVEDAHTRLDDMRDRAAEIEKRVRLAHQAGDDEKAEALQEGVQAYKQHISEERDRVADFADRVNASTTIHEAIHQLLFHTEVQSPFVRYPLWLSEGLATAFETESTSATFGPDVAYGPRDDRFREIVQSDRVWPIERLVTLTRMPDGQPRTIDVVYHQSYAFVTWLSRYHREALRDYLMSYRRLEGEPTADEHLQIFEEAFGDSSDLERTWRRHLQG